MTLNGDMSDSSVHIGVSYVEGIESAPFLDFQNEVEPLGLVMKIEDRGKPGLTAGMEWLLPTAVVIFLGKPYFDGFLREAGKDHYTILKNALLKLGRKFLGKDAPQITVVSSRGKVSSDDPEYSLVFSIYADIGIEARFKLLLKPTTEISELGEAVDAFISTLQAVRGGANTSDEVRDLLESKPIGGTYLVTYDTETSKLVAVDPRPKKSE